MEGRSAMLMDTIALHDELNRIHPCRPPRGRHYVEALCRAALLSEGEFMAWVGENWHSYAYRHIHGMQYAPHTSLYPSCTRPLPRFTPHPHTPYP
jgi:hypothetical protein